MLLPTARLHLAWLSSLSSQSKFMGSRQLA